MAESLGRVRASEAAQIRFAVPARDHDSQRAIRRHPARRIDQVAAADTPSLAQHFGLPDAFSVLRFAVVEQRLVEERDIAGRRHHASGRKIHLAHFGSFISSTASSVIEPIPARGGVTAELPYSSSLAGSPTHLRRPSAPGRTRQSDSQVGQPQRFRDSFRTNSPSRLPLIRSIASAIGQ